MKRTLLTKGVSCALIVSHLGARALIEPRVEFEPPAPQVGEDGEFAAARKRAFDLRGQLASKIADHERFEFWTGVGLFGLGIAGLAVGIYDGSKDLLLGIGLGGATVAGARLFIPSQERRTIYSDGELAVTCALTALSIEADVPNDDESTRARGLRADTTLAGVNISGLRRQVEQQERQLVPSPRLADRAAVPLQETRLRTDQLQEDLAALQQAAASLERLKAARLDAALLAISDAVNAQIGQQAVNPTAARSAAFSEYGTLVDDIASKVTAVEASAERLETAANTTEAAATGTDRAAAAAGAETRALARDISSQMEIIRQRLGLPAGCLSAGLTGAQPGMS